MSNPNTLSPREKTLLATRFFKLMSEKNFDAERTGQSLAFSIDSIWHTNKLDGISKEYNLFDYKPSKKIGLYNSTC
jgi:hypothetical protein